MGLVLSILGYFGNNFINNNNFIEENDSLLNTNRKNRKKQNLVIDVTENKIYENFTKIEKKINYEEVKEIIDVLNRHFVFWNLSNDELEELIIKMFYCKVNKGEYIFKQNDNASCYFIIHEGEVEVEIDGVVKKNLSKGMGFGDFSLLYNSPRSASIKSKTDLWLWGLNRDSYKKFVEEITLKQHKENLNFIKEIKFFENMNEEQKHKIVSAVIIEKFKEDDIIVNKGDQASSYYIIKSGSVSCIEENGKEIRVLNKGDSFGEKALYESEKRSLSVKAKSNVICLVISKENLKNIFGFQINELIEKNWQRWSLEKDKYFSKLNKIQIEKLIRISEIKNFNKEEIILEKKNQQKLIYIIIEGEIKYGENTFEKGKIFNDEFIENMENNKIYELKHDLVSNENTKISLISYENIVNLFGDTLFNIFKKNQIQITEINNYKELENLDKLKKSKEITSLEEIKMLKKIGEGQFGQVYLVTPNNNNSNNLYALKCISKAQINNLNIINHIILEKKILLKLNHPMILKLYNTFNDDHFVYLLLEFINGFDMFDFIRKLDLLENNDTRYYIASLFLALENLHSNFIIYRDLKPENIMINQQGRLILIDFGISKILESKNKLQKTFTLVGTPHYIAPEVLKGKGYNCYVDIWSLGVLMFEFLCGSVPFGEDSDDPYEIYEFIASKELVFPDFIWADEFKNAVNLMKQLLNRLPEARLGGNYSTFKAHEFFDDFDWNDLYQNKINPPHVLNKEEIITENQINDLKQIDNNIEEELKDYNKQFLKKSFNLKKKNSNNNKILDLTNF